jgi:phosphoenolpyruvate carboxylase
MDLMAVTATEEYRSVVFQNPRFVEYFRTATPELEYGRMNIGSRPSKRKPSGGIESLRAIPWIFAWTQTRFHLPVWLGLGAALKQALAANPKNVTILSRMYDQWPFFRVTIDLVEMVFAKGDPRIAELYDTLLVAPELRPFGVELRRLYNETKSHLLKIARHTDILQGNPTLKQRLRLREPYITALNVQQAFTLKKMREQNTQYVTTPDIPQPDSPRPMKAASELVTLNPTTEFAPGLEDTMILTMKGIAAGIQNTG